MSSESPKSSVRVDDPDTHAVRLAKEGQQGAEAVDLLRKAGDAATTEDWETVADVLWRQDDHAHAEIAYRELLTRVPRHDVGLIRLSLCSQWRGDMPDAKALLRGNGTSLLTGPVAARLGHLLLHEGDHVNAEAILRFAIGQRDTPAAAWRDLSETLYASGRRPDAMAIARESYARMPGEPEIQAWLGHLLLEFGEAALATEHLRAALDTGAAPPFARMRFAEALYQCKQPEACIAEARRALEETPGTPTTRALAGYLMIQCGASEDGEALMAEAIAAEPLSAGLRLLHSAAFFDSGRKADAALVAGQAADALPDQIEILDRYGHLLLLTENAGTAFGIFQRALEIKPDHLNSWLGFCEAARLTKRFKDAIAAFRKLNELGADAQTIRTQRYRLFGEMT